MTLTTHQARTQAINIVNETVAEIAEYGNDSLWEKCYRVTSLAAFSLFEVSEPRLRSFLLRGGVNLDDNEEFEMASGIISCFVLSKGLIVTKRLTPSLVDLEHDYIKNYVFNEEMQADIEDTVFQGILWRESLLEL